MIQKFQAMWARGWKIFISIVVGILAIGAGIGLLIEKDISDFAKQEVIELTDISKLYVDALLGLEVLERQVQKKEEE